MITSAEDYFAKGCGRCERFETPDCSVMHWTDGIRMLRAICLRAGLIETAKWGHPCYMHAGRNIAILGALRSDFRLSFFDAALLNDPAGILVKSGPNARCADMVRFTDVAQVSACSDTLGSYLTEAMAYAAAGVRPPMIQIEIETPIELTEALLSDPELAEAFYRLTPGRQRGYLLNLNAAKRPVTRLARLAKFRAHILAGKGPLER